MLNIGSKRFIRRTSAALCAASFIVLVGACTHFSKPDVASPKTWVIENVASKSTSELTADLLAPAVYARSSSKEIDGYTVESGNLTMPDKSVGSLVTVRSKDGSLTAVVGKLGEHGLLTINNKGESRFTPFPSQDYSLPDTVVENATPSETTPSTATAGPYVIDILIGYSRRAVNFAGGNAHANALAQVESVNLALRNSLVSDVSLRLAGVEIVEQEYPITPQTLNALPRIFSAGIARYQPDLVYAVLGGHVDDTAVGWAHVTGRYAIGWVYGEAFRHEVGHNAGGSHCHVPGGSYNHGFQTGKITTAQCGNESPYYSTPAVRDAAGAPIGNAATADMARVWRENAQRLASYEVCLNAPRNFRADLPGYDSIRFQWSPPFCAPPARYEVWQYLGILPVAKYADITGTAVIAKIPAGLRSYRVIGVYSDGKKSEPSELVWTKPVGPVAETK